MEKIIELVRKEMQIFDKGSAGRIQHFTKVHSFASQIGKLEKLDDKTQFILEITAILHDIGIRPAEEKYGYCNGKLQEEIGPCYAREMLEKFEVDSGIIDRVCYLIAHHHTYDEVDGLDYQILLEADFLVNLHENNATKESVKSTFENIFKTKAGKELCSIMFDLYLCDKQI